MDFYSGIFLSVPGTFLGSWSDIGTVFGVRGGRLFEPGPNNRNGILLRAGLSPT